MHIKTAIKYILFVSNTINLLFGSIKKKKYYFPNLTWKIKSYFILKMYVHAPNKSNLKSYQKLLF